jgi:hypothetical protein
MANGRQFPAFPVQGADAPSPSPFSSLKTTPGHPIHSLYIAWLRAGINQTGRRRFLSQRANKTEQSVQVEMTSSLSEPQRKGIPSDHSHSYAESTAHTGHEALFPQESFRKRRRPERGTRLFLSTTIVLLQRSLPNYIAACPGQFRARSIRVLGNLE